jgi:hypothetical protein
VIFVFFFSGQVFTLHARLDNVERVDDQSGRDPGREPGDRLDEGGRAARIIRFRHRDV